MLQISYSTYNDSRKASGVKSWATSFPYMCSMKKRRKYLVLEKLFEGRKEDSTIISKWLRSHTFWKEFVVSEIKDPSEKKRTLSILSILENKLDVWVDINKESQTVKFSFIHPSKDPALRFMYRTPEYTIDDLKFINDRGSIEILPEKDREVALLSLRIKKYEKKAQELKKIRKKKMTV